jgi:OmpA-OmpF porin, OOP family
MTMKRVIIFNLLCICINTLFSQELPKKEFNRLFEEANLVFNYGDDYEKASSLFERLYRIAPDNYNLSAKLGTCYLNIDGKKTEAINLLTKAVSNTVINESDYQETGDKAPLDSWLYLAIGYHQCDSLNKAISFYQEAKKRLGDEDQNRTDYIDTQIRDCKYAMQLMRKPLVVISNLFTPWLIDYPGACNPAISKNDSVFVFTQKTGGKTKIFCSYKTGSWQYPYDITDQLGEFDRMFTNSITGNGKLLIIDMDDGEDGNLYYSQRIDSTWTKIKSLGAHINSIYWESHGFITPDGKTLFIASNRPGGEGESDIWVSERNIDGSWKRPLNCGNVINTPYNEGTPYFDPATSSLLFSSEGHTSMGRMDVFRSINRRGIYTAPIGMPYSFNNTADNVFFVMNNNGPGFITSLYDPASESRNIYSLVAQDPADKITIAQGAISLKDGLRVNPAKVQIQLLNLKKGNQTRNITVSDSASYKFEVKPGDYKLFVSHAGYKPDTINLSIPLYFTANFITVNASLTPEKVFNKDFISIKNILFEFNSYALDEQAKSSLENIKSILKSNPELELEVSGFTDSRGSSEYNKILADKRAQAVIDFLTASGISGTRLIKKAYGASNFVSINTNPDGTENEEGMKYNRRVIFGIRDPQTGITISQEAYAPKHIIQVSTTKYSIVLVKTTRLLSMDYFSKLQLGELHFIKTIQIDSLSLYILGVFNNKPDAEKYLEYVKNKGFVDAYIVNQSEVNKVLKNLISPETGKREEDSKKSYSIQILAVKQPVYNKTQFKGIKKLNEIASLDGYYRYVCGNFDSYDKAKSALTGIKHNGFSDAFIVDVSLPIFK